MSQIYSVVFEFENVIYMGNARSGFFQRQYSAERNSYSLVPHSNIQVVPATRTITAMLTVPPNEIHQGIDGLVAIWCNNKEAFRIKPVLVKAALAA